MHTFLIIMGWSGFALAIVVGLALDLIGLFGNWIILGAVAIAWAATGFAHFGPWSVGVLLALAILGEVLEMVAAAYGATKFGGSRGGALAALAGCIAGSILGTPWFPVIGTIIGACVGAFLGAAAYEFLLMRQAMPQALWTGLGAALGKVAGMFAKLAVGVAMVCVAALTY